ncbi:MAG: carbon storage regulator CsrA [Dehalococcoidia bacterium]|nr:carbon storage regulator CsrA [Dehalococcoidia bacterium]
MLVLSRKAGESILIGPDIRLTILEIDGDHIKVGIQAPRSIPVYRTELWAEIQAENARAASKRRPGAVGVGALPRPSSDATPHTRPAVRLTSS